MASGARGEDDLIEVAALGERADELLAEPPSIETIDLLASKLP